MFNFFSEIKQELASDITFMNDFNIINMSNKAIYIEGHKGIIEVTSQQVSFKLKSNIITINGQNLVLKKITISTALIYGGIKSVETK